MVMAHSRLYIKLMNSREWRLLRAQKLTDQPLCEMCWAKGYVRAAQCVHHIIEVESGRNEQECRDICYRYSNLQSLCYECHQEVHKARGSYKRDGHQQRENERLQRWIAKHGGKSEPPASL